MRAVTMPKSLIVVGVVSLAVAGVMLADTSAVGAEEVPGVEWTRQFGTTGDDWVDGVALDTGGLYVAGVTPGALPGQSSAGGSDAFLRKYDLDGNELWTRQFGTTSEDRGLGVAVDISGVYLTGYTYGALPGYANAGSRDVFVRKYNLDGNELWTRQFGTTGEDLGIELAVDIAGVYLTGGTMGALPGQSSAGAWDVFLRKYDLDGNEQWTRQFGTDAVDQGSGVAVYSGGLYVTGYTAGALPGQSSAGALDAWVRKYDLDGNEEWTRQFGTTSEDSSAGVAVDTGGVYLVGDTMGAFPGQSSAGSGDVFLRKYDQDGNEQWTRQFGTTSHDSGQDMAMDTTGVYLTGHTSGAFPSHTHAGAKDVWVGNYDIDGNEQWTLQFGTTSDDWGLGVAVDTTGGMYLTGPTRGALPGHSNAGGLDVFVRKYHPDAVPTPPLCAGKPATIVGTEGHDVLMGTDAADVIVGLGGADEILAGAGDDVVCGGNGNDKIMGEDGNDRLFGDGGRSEIHGGDGDDELVGAGATDRLFGDEGADVLFGKRGMDHLEGGSGNDTLKGGWENDSIYGGDGDDLLEGGPGDDEISGHSGNDVAYGGGGDDMLHDISYWPLPAIGGDHDVFRGGPGDDWFETNRGDDRFYGGPGRDSFSLGYQMYLGSSVMFGQEGDDWLYFETLEGADPCMLDGVTIRLFGHEGNDHFVVGSLIDIRSCAEIIIKGGAGEGDWYRSGTNSEPMLIDLERGIAKVRPWAWQERFLLTSVENAAGGDGHDLIIGNDAANVLRAERGRDELHGRGGNDTLDGDDGHDHLYGGSGDDTLDGGRNDDHLNGGDGNDSLDGGPHDDKCTQGETYESCEVIL